MVMMQIPPQMRNKCLFDVLCLYFDFSYLRIQAAKYYDETDIVILMAILYLIDQDI